MEAGGFEPPCGNSKAIIDKELTQNGFSVLSTSLDKTLQKQPKIDTRKLPADLAEIVAVWPELPEHIKAAI